MLSTLAGTLGAAGAAVLLPSLKAFAPAGTPWLNTVAMDWRSLSFAFLLTLAVGLFVGLATASRVSRRGPNESVGLSGRNASESRRVRRVKSILAASEFALAMVLLTASALLIRSFLAVLNVDLGFRSEHVLTVRLQLPDTLPQTQRPQVYRDLLDRMSALPDVISVGGVGSLFYLDETRNHALRLVEGHAPEPKGAWKPLIWTQVAGDYFQAMGIPLLRGRFFKESDGPRAAPVAIVNQTLVRRYWPGQDPIGKRLKGFDPRGQNDDWLSVVGVVGDTRMIGLEKTPAAQIFEVQAQRPTEQLGALVVRSSHQDPTLASSLRAVIRSLSRDAVISSITSLDVLVSEQETQRRFQTWLLSVFSGLALLLAALGVFGVMHYAVAARTAEIGLRMAVGANPAHIIRLVLADGFSLAISGIVGGALGAVWSTRVISALLYGVTPEDPISFLSAGLLLLVIALLATWLPARRAAQIDPLRALRQE